MLAKRAWVVLLFVVCAVYFYGLGSVPLLGPDEPRYAEVARGMYERLDLVTPMLGGHTWFEKPALVYWMMAAAFRLFGVTEFAARAGSALAGVLTVLLTGWVAWRAAAGRSWISSSYSTTSRATFRTSITTRSPSIFICRSYSCSRCLGLSSSSAASRVWERRTCGRLTPRASCVCWRWRGSCCR